MPLRRWLLALPMKSARQGQPPDTPLRALIPPAAILATQELAEVWAVRVVPKGVTVTYDSTGTVTEEGTLDADGNLTGITWLEGKVDRFVIECPTDG